MFTEQVIKTDLSSNNGKRIQPLKSIETYAYGMRKDLVSEKKKKLNETI